MAPTKTKSGSVKGQNKRPSKPASGGSSSKSKNAAKTSSAPTTKKNKVSKPQASAAHKAKKRRRYTEKELGIQKLNMITPAGVLKPKGKKKGKVFVDDQESLTTILAMVNADKEGQIESKMLRARQLEEVRQARIRETEARAESKKQKLEDVKDELRKKKSTSRSNSSTGLATSPKEVKKVGRKRVSFDG